MWFSCDMLLNCTINVQFIALFCYPALTDCVWHILKLYLLTLALVNTCFLFASNSEVVSKNLDGFTRAWLHLTFGAVKSSSSHCMKYVLCSFIEGPRAYQQVMSPTSFWHSPLVGWEHCAGLEKGLPSWPQISLNNLQRVGFSVWFTAPTETKLGTATVSAPGPLSSSQDELFAEDIQMYKEQIRLTQSSFAWREKEREKKKKEHWLTSKRSPPSTSFCFLNEWMGLGIKTALCIQSTNSQLIPLIHSWRTFNCVSSHSKDMFVAFNWRFLWNHSNVWLVGPA